MFTELIKINKEKTNKSEILSTEDKKEKNEFINVFLIKEKEDYIFTVREEGKLFSEEEKLKTWKLKLEDNEKYRLVILKDIEYYQFHIIKESEYNDFCYYCYEKDFKCKISYDFSKKNARFYSEAKTKNGEDLKIEAEALINCKELKDFQPIHKEKIIKNKKLKEEAIKIKSEKNFLEEKNLLKDIKFIKMNTHDNYYLFDKVKDIIKVIEKRKEDLNEYKYQQIQIEKDSFVSYSNDKTKRITHKISSLQSTIKEDFIIDLKYTNLHGKKVKYKFIFVKIKLIFQNGSKLKLICFKDDYVEKSLLQPNI